MGIGCAAGIFWRALAAGHGLQIWEAIILAVSAEARCRLLLSEDMQDGFTWRGLTVVNPFAEHLHPQLLPLLGLGQPSSH